MAVGSITGGLFGESERRSLSDLVADVFKPPATSPQGGPLTIEEGTELINCERRRLTIDLVGRADEKMTLRELSKAIASTENEKPVVQLSSKEYKRVYSTMCQNHLPRMDEIGVVEYNADRQTIEPGPAFDHAQRVLEGNRDLHGSDGGDRA